MPEKHEKRSLPGFAVKWKASFETTGRLPTAYLFVGPPDSAKEETARFLCETLLSRSENHPDLIWIAPEKNSIKIDGIRELIQRVSFKPLQGKHLIVVMADAETMTDGAANALLKTLEEPPSYVLFILLTGAPERLLPTIRSRCQRVSFQANAGALQERFHSYWEEWKDSLSPLFEEVTPSFSKISEMVESVAQEADRLPFLIDLLRTLWHDMAVYRETRDKTRLLLPEALGVICRESDRRNAESLFEGIDLIQETERAIEGNVNRTLALERLFSKIFS